MTGPDNTLYESNLESLELLRRGKVRDIYAVDDEHLLIVASDRLSAFDVVLGEPIPGKGAILTRLSNFWFRRTAGVVQNHTAAVSLRDVLPDPEEYAQVAEQATVVRRLAPLPMEAIVRGFLIGSGWKDYQKTGAVSGLSLPRGLRQADRLPSPIFTPSTKAEVGDHDENIDFSAAEKLLGSAVAESVRGISLHLYTEAAAFARTRGIIIADTKFEFALGDDGRLVLIDEVLTPDSSRFWPADEYRPSTSPPSFDKQFVRDYLETQTWDKRPPAPKLPPEIVAQTAAKYREAEERLTAS